MLCWGFPWKIPQAALDVPRLGSVNMHPALLPRHRGPIPLAWALRDGDDAWGQTWHRMDAELDTGNLLVAGDGSDRGRRRRHPGLRRQAERRRARPSAAGARARRGGRSRRSATNGGCELGRAFRGRRLRPDRLVATRRGRSTTRCAPGISTFGLSGLRAPIARLDGDEVVVLQTRLTDPGSGARRVECGDGPIWVVATEPV